MLSSPVFVIVPFYNEETTIRQVTLSLLENGYCPVLVNDGSTDRSGEIARRLPVCYLEHEINLGQGAALQTGISFCLLQGAAFIITFDADGQHDVADIKSLVAPLNNKQADIVFGSRFLDGANSNIGWIRRLALQIARLLNYCLSGLMLSDAHNGLRAMNRYAAETIFLREAGMAHASEIHIQAARNKLRSTEIPVTVRYTDYSRSKGQSAWNGLRIFFDLIFNQSNK